MSFDAEDRLENPAGINFVDHIGGTVFAAMMFPPFMQLVADIGFIPYLSLIRSARRCSSKGGEHGARLVFAGMVGPVDQFLDPPVPGWPPPG